MAVHFFTLHISFRFNPQHSHINHTIVAKMVVIYCAYTEQINPSGASAALTRDQVWKGLQRKIRKAQDFVPVIEGCDVIEEKDNEVVRKAHFKAFAGNPPHSVREVCKSYYPTRVGRWRPPSLKSGDANFVAVGRLLARRWGVYHEHNFRWSRFDR